MGIIEVVQIVLIILKICGVIAASWALVLIPLWIVLGLWVAALLLCIVYIWVAGWADASYEIKKAMERAVNKRKK